MSIESISTNSIALPTQSSEVGDQSGTFNQLWDVIGKLNDGQIQADTKIKEVLTGQSDDAHGALIGLEKAEIQMQLAATVRDKLTQGYQQIINMQL